MGSDFFKMPIKLKQPERTSLCTALVLADVAELDDNEQPKPKRLSTIKE